jgi:ATP-dependent protease Clp ATPase subunit
VESENTGEVVRCSFCNKSSRDVRTIVAGPVSKICDECISICADIVAERIEDYPAARNTPSTSNATFRCSLCWQVRPAQEGTRIPQRGALCKECQSAVSQALEAQANDT